MNLVEKVDLRKIHYLNSLTFKEYKTNVNSSKKTDKDLKVLYDKLKNYCEEMIKGKGEFKRTYHHTLNTPLEAGGRLFCGGSIQGQPKSIRGFLFGDTTTDIDMKNAHPTILRYICKKNNIDCAELEYYINNRDEILSKFPNREEAKSAYLSALNDENLSKKLNKYPKEITKKFKDFDKEMKEIQKKVIQLEQYKHCVNCVPASRQYNFNGSAINRIMCYEENKILQIILDKLANREIELSSLMFDGCMPYGNFYDDADLLRDLTSAINSHEDYKDLLNIELTYKEHSTDIVIPIDFVEPDKKDKKKIKDFNEVSTEFEKSHCKIISKSIFIKHLDNENIVMNKQGLKTSYEHLVFEKYNKDGDIVYDNFIRAWLESNPNQKCFDDIGVFPNESICPKNIFNMWRKFDMDLVTTYTEKKEELKDILLHINILCNREENVYEYLIAWISQMIQYPEVKTICPTFISQEGSGKGTLMRLFEKMLGKNKVFETTNPSRDIWGDFNGRMANTFLINLNELSKKDTLECEGKIKGLITDPKITINNKGVNQYDIESYHRFMISTNNEEPINTSKDDRRKVIIRCSDELCGNKEHFDKMYNYLDDVDVIKTCYEYFKNYKIKIVIDKEEQEVDMKYFNKIPLPITEYHKELQSYSTSPIELWVKDWIENYDGDEEEVSRKINEWYCLFEEWKNKSNLKYYCDINKFPVRLGRLKINGVDKIHTEYYNLTCFTIKTLKEYFGIGCLLK